MAKKKTKASSKKKKEKKAEKNPRQRMVCGVQDKCSGGGIYFLGFIGSAAYYITATEGFWMGVLGVLKALVWPAFLIFALMKYLGA